MADQVSPMATMSLATIRPRSGNVYGRAELGIARQSVYLWLDNFEAGGSETLASKSPAGCRAKMARLQTEPVVETLLNLTAADRHYAQLWLFFGNIEIAE